MHEQRYFWMAVATIVMWVVIAAISIVFLIAAQADALGAAIFVIIMTGIGGGGMAVVWDAAKDITKAEIQAEAAYRSLASQKTKRETSRLARLVNDLDDDELVELETLLMARESGPLDYRE